jgi:isocitrate/isopropylmalate dehydrogenase
MLIVRYYKLLIIRENTECLYVKDEEIKETKEGKVAIAKRVKQKII